MGLGSKVAGAMEERLSRAFGSLGWWVAARPWTCIGLCIIFAAALSAGVLFIESETDPDYLYTPLGNRAQKDLDTFNALFSHEPRKHLNAFIVYTKEGRNLFSAQVLNGIYRLVQDLRKINLEDGSRTLSWQDVCLQADLMHSADGRCAFGGVADLMEGPIDDDTDLPLISPVVTADRFGGFVGTALFAGGRTLSGDGEKVVGVKAFKFYVNLAYNENEDDQTRISFEDVQAYSKLVFAHLEQVAEQMAADPEALFQVTMSFDWSDSEELDKSTNGDQGFFVITMGLVIGFSLFVSRSWTNSILSKGNVIWGAVAGVLLAIGSAFGLMGYLGVKFNAVVAISIFLLVGLGVDDAYVMIQGYHSSAAALTPHSTVQERMAETFRTAGVSIFFTSFTDALAFVVGATSVFPAVRAFCLFAAAGVAFDFLFQVLLFGAVLALDAHREYCGVPGWKAALGLGWLREERYSPAKTLIRDGKGPDGGAIPVMPEQAWLARSMRGYGAQLVKAKWSAVVVAVFAGYLAFAVIGVLQVDTGLDFRDLAPAGSYWVVYLNTNFDYFTEFGPAFDLAFPAGTVDWSSAGARREVEELFGSLERLECLHEEPRGLWLRQFYADASEVVPMEALTSLEGQDFYQALDQWLEGPGMMFRDDVVLSEGEEGMRVEQSRGVVRMEALETNTGEKQGIPCMRAAREVLDAWAAEHVAEEEEQPVVSFIFLRHWESGAVIVQQTVYNLLYAAIACFAVTLLILPHPVLCLVAMTVVASILAGLVATMSLVLQIRIETISMIDLVMSIGFSIDNVAHYLHAYMISPQATPREKAINALERIGIPILQGDASTMLALLPLTASSSRIFRSFFLILFSVLLLGALHALVLLPALLAHVGPLPDLSHRSPQRSPSPSAQVEPQPQAAPLPKTLHPQQQPAASVVADLAPSLEEGANDPTSAAASGSAPGSVHSDLVLSPSIPPEPATVSVVQLGPSASDA